MAGFQNTVFSRILENPELDRQLSNRTFIEVVLNNLPGKHSSLHINNITNRQFNIFQIFKHFSRLFILFIKYLSKKNHYTNSSISQYDFLILVPNFKFRSHYNVIAEKIEGDIKVICLEDTGIKGEFNIKKYVPNRTKILFKFTLGIVLYSFIALRSKQEMKLLINNLDLAQKFIFNILILNEFFRKYNFKKYLSLLPNIDHHFIIEIFFANQFDRTYAIRATATSLAEEHKFIQTQTLFYKSKIEKRIYCKLLINKCIKLEPASLLEKQNCELLNRKYPATPKNILFLDTCLSKSKRYNRGRLTAIMDYYNLLENNYSFKLFHKFHPALDFENRNAIMKQYKNVVYLGDLDQNYFHQIDLIVGFYSTIFQFTILNKIPIIALSNYFGESAKYQAFQEIDIEHSPICRINNQYELENLFKNIFSVTIPYNVYLKTDELNKYILDVYNYPEGLNQMYKVLNQ